MEFFHQWIRTAVPNLCSLAAGLGGVRGELGPMSGRQLHSHKREVLRYHSHKFGAKVEDRCPDPLMKGFC